MATTRDDYEVKEAPTRRPRRDKRRERNLETLLDAALKVLASEGPGALTPLRVAEQAGLHRRAFYAHFADAQACLEAVAVRISEQDFKRNEALHREAFAKLPPDRRASIAAVLDSLETAVKNRGIYLVLYRCRHDESVVGEAVRKVLEDSYDVWTELMWDLAMHYGVTAAHLRDVRYLAEHLVDHHNNAIGRAVSGRDKDLPALAQRMQRYNTAMVVSEFRRMLGLRPIANELGPDGQRR